MSDQRAVTRVTFACRIDGSRSNLSRYRVADVASAGYAKVSILADPVTLSAIVLGAFGNIYAGVLGNRADAALCSLGKTLIASLAEVGLPRNHDALRAMRRAQLDALGSLAGVYRQGKGVNTAKDLLDRDIFLKQLDAFVVDQENGLDALELTPLLAKALVDSVDATLARPTSNGSADRLHTLASEAALEVWNEIANLNPPAAFRRLFNGLEEDIPSWFQAYGAFLGQAFKDNENFKSIFTADRLANILGETVDLRLELGRFTVECDATLNDLRKSLDGVDEKTNQVLSNVVEIKALLIERLPSKTGVEYTSSKSRVLREGGKPLGCDFSAAEPPSRRTAVGAFPSISGFEGRIAERALLAETLSDPAVGVVALCQIGGAGKTCLALKAIEDLLAKQSQHFEAIFQFTFYGGRNQDEFMQELGNFASEVLNELPPSSGIEAWLQDVLRQHAVLLLLDGMELIQSSNLNGEVGRLQQGGVRTLLLWLCNQDSIRSVVLVTSRLELRDLLPYRGARYQPIELPGLSLNDGTRVLRRHGVEASASLLQKVVADLNGHPLGLLVFANSTNRITDARGNVASIVMRKTQLSKTGSLDAKLGRLLAYYRKIIDEVDSRLIASVTVFPDGAPADWLKNVFAVGGETSSRRVIPAAQLNERLERLTREGILQAVPTLAHTEYTAHPVIRESFRSAASGLVETAAQLHLATHPSSFRPKTALEIIPYLRAVQIYCENGNFIAADRVMNGNLENGLALSKLGEWRLLFNLMWQFVQPERRELCQAELGQYRYAQFLPLAIDASIALSEWEIAEDLCAVGSGVLTPIQLFGRQAAIQANIGSPMEAERLLRLGISASSAVDKLHLEPALAEALRAQGKLRESWRLLRDWIRYQPRTLDELVAWIANWNETTLCAARIWYRNRADIGVRLLDAMDKAQPTPLPFRGVRAAFLDYQKLALMRREARDIDHWIRILELARTLGDNAARMSQKEADGGWMIGILEALNGLGKYKDALRNVPAIFAQLHENSFYRPWVEIEAGRAHQNLGQPLLARELIGRALKQALASRSVMMAHRAALLWLELENDPTPNATEALARQLVDVVAREAPSQEEFYLDVPLPGEEGWESHLASLLTNCVTVAPVEGTSLFDSALQLAAQWGVSAVIPALLAQGGRPLFGNDLEQCPLMLAVRAGHVEAAYALLKDFGPLNLNDSAQASVALAAIEYCDTDVVEFILSRANSPTQEWLSNALVQVANGGDERLLDLLLKYGADPAILDANGNLPLVQAAQYGNVNVFLRLSHLTSISSADVNGRTALTAALENNQKRVIDLLAGMNVDANKLDYEEQSVADRRVKAGAIESLILLATRFGLQIDRDRHLLPAIKAAEQFGYDWELRLALTWLGADSGERWNVPDLRPKIRGALRRLAAKRKLKVRDENLTSAGINIGLVVNARGKMCLVHDRPFAATPLWVGYHVDRRQLEIIFDTGTTFPIEWDATDEMHIYFLKIDKILIIRMQDKKPVEGYDTSFLRLRKGKTIEL